MVIEAIEHELEKLGHKSTDDKVLTYKKVQKYDDNWCYLHTCRIITYSDHYDSQRIMLTFSDDPVAINGTRIFSINDPAFDPQELVTVVHQWLTKN